MANDAEYESESSQDNVSGRCKACGDMFWAVDQDEYDRIVAGHVLEDHADEASEALLENCRELVESDPDVQ